ncbi:MAG TPA: deoxyguanosinetriphosphate triphosphohydrolase [Terriglobia bacterium]|nr:deoxyguanosinetriphosphate triphosphohydrolase [Terriglobia bacterium]
MRFISDQKPANYAMTLEKSLGRRHPEPVHPYRDDYERDRDRIIHSRAFRRLENKTQVFTKRYSDHFRTRLTHTLEVAQISRTVARALRLNQSLVDALALAHDIGHPPFGHAGEEALNQLMARYKEGFDHNLHALRIVERFEQKYIDFSGLNLTFEVREGIVKHSRDYRSEEHPELSEYLLDQRPPLEAQLIDLADEIAYNCADLDDGYEARLLSLDLIRAHVPLFDEFFRPIWRQHRRALEKLQFNEALRRVVNALVTDLIEATRSRLRMLKINSVEKVRKWDCRLVSLSSDMAKENRKLKEFLQAYLYAHPDVGSERKRISRQIVRLFRHYMRNPRALPSAHLAKSCEEPLARIVCDYIAGMTDNFFERQYQKVFGE